MEQIDTFSKLHSLYIPKHSWTVICPISLEHEVPNLCKWAPKWALHTTGSSSQGWPSMTFKFFLGHSNHKLLGWVQRVASLCSQPAPLDLRMALPINYARLVVWPMLRISLFALENACFETASLIVVAKVAPVKTSQHCVRTVTQPCMA